MFNSFAISLMWTDPVSGVCVTETNQDGCTGNPVCMEVFVEDDVWSVEVPRVEPPHSTTECGQRSLGGSGIVKSPQSTLECWSMTEKRCSPSPFKVKII